MRITLKSPVIQGASSLHLRTAGQAQAPYSFLRRFTGLHLNHLTRYDPSMNEPEAQSVGISHTPIHRYTATRPLSSASPWVRVVALLRFRSLISILPWVPPGVTTGIPHPNASTEQKRDQGQQVWPVYPLHHHPRPSVHRRQVVNGRYPHVCGIDGGGVERRALPDGKRTRSGDGEPTSILVVTPPSACTA